MIYLFMIENKMKVTTFDLLEKVQIYWSWFRVIKVNVSFLYLKKRMYFLTHGQFETSIRSLTTLG